LVNFCDRAGVMQLQLQENRMYPYDKRSTSQKRFRCITTLI